MRDLTDVDVEDIFPGGHCSRGIRPVLSPSHEHFLEFFSSLLLLAMAEVSAGPESAKRRVWRWKNDTTPTVRRQWWILLLAATCAAPASPYGLRAPGPALSRSLSGLPLLQRPASELWSREQVGRKHVRGHTGVSPSVLLRHAGVSPSVRTDS